MMRLRAVCLGLLLPLVVPLTSHAAAGLPETACPIGTPAAARAADTVPITPPVVVDCGRLRRQGSFRLVGYRIGGESGRTHICLETQLASGEDVDALCPQPVRPVHLGLKKQFSYFEGEAPAQLNRFDLLARSASARLLDRRYIDLRQISAARS